MPTAPAPIARYLVPDVPPQVETDARFTRVRERVPAGVPHVIALAEGLRLVLVVPTGLAAAWRDADPVAVVTESASEHAAHDAAAATPPPRVPARLVLQDAREVLASVPLVAHRRLWLPDSGGSDHGVRIELVVLGWDIRAGSLRGPGDVGSWIEIAWRIADRASAEFSAPRVSPDVLERLPKKKPPAMEVLI
jgi:hypothetical protein